MELFELSNSTTDSKLNECRYHGCAIIDNNNIITAACMSYVIQNEINFFFDLEVYINIIRLA